MYKIDQLLSIFNDRINELQFPKEPKNLYEPVKYILGSEGKRVRPVMVLLACDMFAVDIEKCINSAIAIEIFHNFTLLHDDIMDKAVMRRGKECVHLKWDDNTAILSGDTMSVLSYKYIVDGIEPDKIIPVLNEFNKLSIGVCEGQQYDMNFEREKDVTVDGYLKMITLKTAVLIAGALKIGAIIGGASESDTQKLYDIGINLGIAFQIMDDILDMYAGETKFGKLIGGDVLSGKKSYLYLIAIEKADAHTKKQLEQIYDDTLMDATCKVETVRKIYDKIGVRDYATSLANSYSDRALSLIDEINVEQDRKSAIKELSLLLINRDK